MPYPGQTQRAPDFLLPHAGTHGRAHGLRVHFYLCVCVCHVHGMHMRLRPHVCLCVVTLRVKARDTMEPAHSHFTHLTFAVTFYNVF